jgi:beta-lactam-binding protein with PASTA domain
MVEQLAGAASASLPTNVVMGDATDVMASKGALTGVADNSFFRSEIDSTKLNVSIIRPVKTVVVSQNPRPGDQVPAGTPVNLTVARIDDIPLSSLKDTGGLQSANLGVLHDSVASAPADVKHVLATSTDFNSLSAADKGLLTTYVGSLGGTDAAKAFPALKLVVNL